MANLITTSSGLMLICYFMKLSVLLASAAGNESPVSAFSGQETPIQTKNSGEFLPYPFFALGRHWGREIIPENASKSKKATSEFIPGIPKTPLNNVEEFLPGILKNTRTKIQEFNPKISGNGILKFNSERQKEMFKAHEVGRNSAELEKKPNLATLKEAMKACQRALRFFRTHLTEMNLDSVIGTRIAEAQFKMVWKALYKKPWNALTKDSGYGPMDILGWTTAVNGVRDLYLEAEELNSVAQPFIRTTRPKYYAKLGGLLQPAFWEIPLSTKIFNATEKPSIDPEKVLNGVEQLVESQSDQCVSETGGPGADHVIESQRDYEKYQGKCDLSKTCWDLMTKPGYSGYSLTHQVFYIVIGLQAGCSNQLEHLALHSVKYGKRRTVANFLEEICYSVLGEANAIAEAGFPENRQDLFMEQGALCGILGYRDFFKKEWLANVLSWQRPTGCYGDFRIFSASHKHKHLSSINKTTPLVNNRVKREESPMEENCLAHRTAVALGYLSLYVRYLAMSLFA